MDKENDQTVEGVVRAQLPSGLYEVEIEGRHRITAHIGAGSSGIFVRVLVGDRVVVELTRRDLPAGGSSGRRRESNEGQSVGQKDLRQVQSVRRRGGARDLHETRSTNRDGLVHASDSRFSVRVQFDGEQRT